MRTYRAGVVVTLMVGVVVCAMALTWSRTFGDSAPASGTTASLSRACENYAVAARQFAQNGPQAVSSGTNAFAFGPGADPTDALKTLSDACSAERARSN